MLKAFGNLRIPGHSREMIALNEREAAESRRELVKRYISLSLAAGAFISFQWHRGISGYVNASARERKRAARG